MNATAPATDLSTLHPDPAAISAFAALVFGGMEGFVPVRMLREKGTAQAAPWSKYFPVNSQLADNLQQEAEKAASDGRGLFVVPGTVEKAGSAKAAEISETSVVVVDIDAGDIAAKHDHLVRYLGPAALEVASGGRTDEGQEKLHLYWKLTTIARTAEVALVCRLRAVIALKAGGDPAFASAHQPIRVPGSIHGKSAKATLVTIRSASGQKVDLDVFEHAVEAMPALPGLAVRGLGAGAASSSVGADALMTHRVRENGIDGINRFDALAKVIGHWLRAVRLAKATIGDAWHAVDQYNTAMIVPPWPQDRLRAEFDALLGRDIEGRGSAPGANKAGGNSNAGDGVTGGAEADMAVSSAVDGSGSDAPALSEDALAGCFAARHASHWRHVAAWGAWYRWTGTHWSKDDSGLFWHLVRLVCRDQALALDSPAQARRIASDKTIRAVGRLAACDPVLAAHAEDWDALPMRLNTPGGIVDLPTGELHAHDPGAMMTQITKTSPGNVCPLWLEFLHRVTGGDTELVAYLARVCGYCLSGSTTEQVFFFLHGQGANGKSVFLQVISTVLGTYAATAPLETFMASRGESHPTDLAGLRGARLVSVTETEAGRAWAESRIKAITGGDRLRARFMRQDFFEFAPTFKLLVADNHRPSFDSAGEAMRRRLHLIPFAVTIPPGQRDRALTEKLIAEQDGILGWMLAGCADWQKVGLAPPPTVADAAAEYFSDEDIVGQWIAECCNSGPSARASSATLFSSWSEWATASGHNRGSKRSLGEALAARGYAPVRSGRLRAWTGIGLRDRSDGSPGHDSSDDAGLQQ